MGMEYFVINSKITSNSEDTPTGQLRGKDYYILESTIIVEGVLNGLLYPKSEISKFIDAWNGCPTTRKHPKINNKPVSANIPLVLDNTQIGFIFNTRMDGNKLLTDVWIEKEKYTDEIKNATEVSTGLFLEAKEEQGTFNGVEYKGIAINYRPDHLAILPDEEGACSNEDGCNLKHNTQQEDNVADNITQTNPKEPCINCSVEDIEEDEVKTNEETKEPRKSLFARFIESFVGNKKDDSIVDNTSFEAIRERVNKVLKERYEDDNNWVYVIETNTSDVIFEISGKVDGKYTHKYYRIGYFLSEDDTKVTLADTKTEVIPEATWKEVNTDDTNIQSNNNNNTGDEMSEPKKTGEISTNSDGTVTMSLEKLEEVTTNAANKAVNAYKVNQAKETEETTRLALVEEISANEKNYLTEDILKGLAVNQLEDIKAKLSVNSEEPKSSFVGNGAQTIETNNDGQPKKQSIGETIRANRKGDK